MAYQVDPSAVIRELATKLGQKEVELTMANIAIEDLSNQLTIATATSDDTPSPDGT